MVDDGGGWWWSWSTSTVRRRASRLATLRRFQEVTTRASSSERWRCCFGESLTGVSSHGFGNDFWLTHRLKLCWDAKWRNWHKKDVLASNHRESQSNVISFIPDLQLESVYQLDTVNSSIFLWDAILHHFADEKLHEVLNDTCVCMPRSPLKCGSSHEMLQQNQLPWEVQASPLKITAECKDRWRIGCCFHASVSPKTMQKVFPLQDHQSTLQMVWIRESGNRGNLEIGSVRCTWLAKWPPCCRILNVMYPWPRLLCTVVVILM